MVKVPKNLDVTAEDESKGSSNTSDQEVVEDLSTPVSVTTPTVLSELITEGQEEEKEEFFMAPENAALNIDASPKIRKENENVSKPNKPNEKMPGLLPGSPDLTNENTSNEHKDNISQTLAEMNSRLSKLDKLESLNLKLEGNLSRLQSKVEDMSNTINTVKSDLSKYEQRWENTVKGLAGRISELEKTSQSWEKRWELQREALDGDCKILQASMDSNSKKILEIESNLNQSKQQWQSLNKLEEKIKNAAEAKFQEVQKIIREDLLKELLDKVKPAKSPEITQDDLARVREEIMTKMQAQNEDVVSKVKAQQQTSDTDLQYSQLKGQAFSNRHNILIFGLRDSESNDNDLKEAHLFFKDRMGLTNLKIRATFRLGTFRQGTNNPRPLVVKFSDIKDRWRVWNNKRKIKFDKDHPVRIQEDLPKKMREDHRVLQRIAKAATKNPNRYSDVKVRDYTISINGRKYTMGEIQDLPSELQPESVYTPRSSEAVVFFTKHSPLSNHHQSPFVLDGREFGCVEQYLAVCKANMAQNPILAERAMETTDPASHKVILNTLRKDVQKQWAEQAPEILLPAIRAKFHQNEKLMNFLIETYPLAIGEASRDSMWGVGLQLEHEEVLNTSKWEQHGNLLGNTLAQVRAELMDSLNNLPAQ